MLFVIGGPSRVGKTTLAARVHELTGASLVTTDALVWMLEIGAPELGVRHGSEAKPVDLERFVFPFVEAATVYGNRDLILEGDAISPAAGAGLRTRWEGARVVFLTAPSLPKKPTCDHGAATSPLSTTRRSSA